MRARTTCKSGAVGLATGAVVLTLAAPGGAVDTDFGDGGHGFGRMGPSTARTTSVSPSSGPDFEMPFRCGQTWTGSSRSSHSPSHWTIDWNRSNDLGKPVLASAPGVVTRARSLTGSYGRHVIVDHGAGYTTLYAHLNRIASTVGQVVDQGELIGYLGTSGNSTGPHLHHEERLNGAYFAPYLHRKRFSFGSSLTSKNCTDRPVAGDWDGNGRSEIGLFRTSARRTTFVKRTAKGNAYVAWGIPGDKPVVGDFDGDNVSQIGVRQRGAPNWYLRSRSGARAKVANVGATTDYPVTGDWDGNGRDNLGYYRFSSRTFYLRADSARLSKVVLGVTGEQPVTGDWNGDGRTDLGTYNQRTGKWTLRVPSGKGFTLRKVAWGRGGMPVTGDWNGDKITDLAVWKPSTATFNQRYPTVARGTTFRNKALVYGNRR
jgi:hypothetical protein